MTFIGSHLVKLFFGLLLIPFFNYPRGVLAAVGEVKEILGGGDPVHLGDFPWVVGILDVSLGEEVRKLVCGGSILSPSHVLTSGRCVTRWMAENGTHDPISPSSLRLIAGDISRMEDEVEEQIRPILHIIIHPQFKYDEGYKGQGGGGGVGVEPGKKPPEKGFVNDLALLVVEPPFNISGGGDADGDGGGRGVAPISLRDSNFYSNLINSDAEELSLGGWGITDKRQNTIPTGIALKKVTLPFTSSKFFLDNDGKRQKSSSIFGLWLDRSSTPSSSPSLVQFSSGLGSDRGLMGRCMGDPGSGVVVRRDGGHGGQDKGGSSILVGMVSFGIWCDRYLPSGQLLLLTPSQLDWIEELINPKFWAFLSLGVIGMLLVISGCGVLFVRRKRGGLRSWNL